MLKTKLGWTDVLWVWLIYACVVLMLSTPGVEVKLYHNLAVFFRRCAYEFGRRAIAAEKEYWDAVERIRR